METIVAHDYLFQLKTMQDDKVLVQETTNERARRLALYEIQTFKAMLTRSMHTVAHGQLMPQCQVSQTQRGR